jgi:hypothetical protein
MGLCIADLSVDDPNSYTCLGTALDDLKTEAELQSESELSPTHAARIRICRTYLYLLGYLAKDSKLEQLDSTLRDATDRFQADAGLRVSSELDNATWIALSNLCQFQSPCPVKNYFDGNRPSPALLRAIQLRLFSLGLVKDIYSHKQLDGRKKKRADERLQEGFKQFCDLQVLLNLSDSKPGEGFSSHTVELLLHHDGQIQKLQPGATGGFKISSDAGETGLDNRAIKSLVSRFVKNLTLVELWLLGYPVRPGQFRPEGSDHRLGDDSMVKALKKFVGDRGLSSKFSSRNHVVIGPWFFQEIEKVHREAAAAQHEDLDEDVLVHMETNRKFQRSLASTYSGLGSRIFDGIKRVFGWFRKGVKKAFEFLKRSLKNLARLLKQGALKVYERIKAVVTAVRLGIEFYAQPVFPGSDPEAIYVKHDGDFDFDVFVHADCPADRAEVFFERLNLRAELFQLACLIVGKLLSMARAVFKRANPVTGWLGMLITLTKLGRWLKSLHQLAGVSAERLAQLSDLQTLEAHFAA